MVTTRNRAGVIVFCRKENKVALMRRIKQGKEYWVVPGGGIENGETPLVAACRELYEELGLSAVRLFELAMPGENACKDYYFTGEADSSAPLRIFGEENLRQSPDNVFDPRWVTVEEMRGLTVYPAEVAGKFLELVAGFADIAMLFPSQLYINAQKLAAVEAWFSAECIAEYEPLPVAVVNNRLILLDGHTRALAAWRAGARQIRIVLDDDFEKQAYEICANWCIQEGITSVASLEQRIVADSQYNQLWLARCAEMHKELGI